MTTPPQHDDETPEWERVARSRVGALVAGKWRLDALLGLGGTSAVYAATHRNGNRAALKVMRVDRVTQASRARLLREAYVANQLAREGAVTVLDDGVDGELVYLVMDLLEGETLSACARRQGGRLPLGDVWRIGEDLLAIVAAAHERKIVHRDLKPENIFLEASGRVRVLDFGLARVENDADASAITHSNATLGTPAFMSPEQAWGRGREADARSDVWGVGATMFTLLTGRLLHPSATAAEMLVRTATEPARSVGDFARDVPPALVAVVDRALAFHAADRWSDGRAMLVAWRAARANGALAPVPFARAVVDSAAVETDASGVSALGRRSTANDAVSELAPRVASSPRNAEGRRFGTAGIVGVVVVVALSAATAGTLAFVRSGHPRAGVAPREPASGASSSPEHAVVSTPTVAATTRGPAPTLPAIEASPSASVAPVASKPAPHPDAPNAANAFSPKATHAVAKPVPTAEDLLDIRK